MRKILWVIIIALGLFLSACASEVATNSEETVEPAQISLPQDTSEPTPPAEQDSSMSSEPQERPQRQWPPVPQPTQEPAPPPITMKIADNVKAAMVELLVSLPIFDGAIVPPPFELYDLEKTGIPLVIIKFSAWEDHWNIAYKYSDGKYVEISQLDGYYSFYTDGQRRLVLYEGGSEHMSAAIDYSYISIEADKFIRDTVYHDEGYNSSGYYNYINDELLNWNDENEGYKLTDPKILDNTLKRVAAIDTAAVDAEARRALDERLAKIKAASKVILVVNGPYIVRYDITVVEHEGVFYTPAQDIMDCIGATLEYDEASKTIHYSNDASAATLYVDEPYLGSMWRNLDNEFPRDPPRIINNVLMFPATFDFYCYSSKFIPEENVIDLYYSRYY